MEKSYGDLNPIDSSGQASRLNELLSADKGT